MDLTDNKYYKIEYIREDSIIISRWKAGTVDLTDEKFLELGAEFSKLVEQYKPKGYLNYMKEFKFAIAPALQEKIDEHIVGAFIKSGVKKVAIVLPTELVSQLSMEQLAEEKMGKKIGSRLFDNEDKAMKWLAEE